MYIKREELWWVLPILIALFLLGGSIAKLQENAKKATTPTIAAKENTLGTINVHRQLTRQLLAQLTPDKQSPLAVETDGLVWTGHFQGETFEITTKQDGRDLRMQRVDGQFHFAVDGALQDAHALPYSLFTPFEHAKLLDKELHVLTPVPLNESGWQGYQLAMPASELKTQMSAWLGPAFSEAEITDALQQTQIVYQLWFEPESKKLKQFIMTLLGSSQHGSTKREQVTFRF